MHCSLSNFVYVKKFTTRPIFLSLIQMGGLKRMMRKCSISYLVRPSKKNLVHFECLALKV